MGMFSYTFVILVEMTRITCKVTYIHIGVRLRVARFDEQAMRRPSMVKRATGDWLHVFFYILIKHFFVVIGGRDKLDWDDYNILWYLGKCI